MNDNYFIPASIDTVSKLHESSLELLKQAKERQSEIENLTNFVNTTIFSKMKATTTFEIEQLVKKKQQLLNSYTKLLTKINQQHESIK